MNLESRRFALGQRDTVERRAVQIDDAVAPGADQVVVPGYLCIKASRCTGVVNPPSEPQVHERVEHAVDRFSRDVLVTAPGGLANLVGRGMIAALDQNLQYDPALIGERESAFPANGRQIVERARDVGCHERQSMACDTKCQVVVSREAEWD